MLQPLQCKETKDKQGKAGLEEVVSRERTLGILSDFNSCSCSICSTQDTASAIFTSTDNHWQTTTTWVKP